jgi:hypothetical protein
MTTQAERDAQKIREQVMVMTGERGDKRLSVLRRGELLALVNRPLLSSQVTAAPTMEQHNALQADVKALFDALDVLSNRLGTAKLLGQ